MSALGVPVWSWRQYLLRWSGPIGPEHRMRLVLASPAVNRLLTALRLGLLGLLGFVVVAGAYLGLLDAIWNPIIQAIL